jgi:hyperosmotically inducible periplasmic protein
VKTSTLFCMGSTLIALFSSAVSAQTVDATSAQTAAPSAGKSMRVQNRQTSRAVRKALTATKGLESDKIVVLAKGGAVTLAGSVPAEAQIQLAESAAKRVPQARSVSNELTVKEPGGGN